MYQLDETTFNKIFDSESKAESIAAMNQMLQGVAQQAFTMAQLHNGSQMDSRFGQLSTEMQPYMTAVDQQREQVMQQQFFTAHPTLKGMEQVVGQVLAGVKQEGRQFSDQKTLFGEVAKRTQAIIEHISGGQQSAGGVQNAGQTAPIAAQGQQAQVKPRMASVSQGGVGGAGGGQGSATSPNAAKSIFG